MLKRTTTIKLSKEIKKRIDHLRVYPKESYDEIIKRMLETLNICRINPIKARNRLVLIERQRKMNGLNAKDEEENKASITLHSEFTEDEE